jgi:hypothetical protein
MGDSHYLVMPEAPLVGINIISYPVLNTKASKPNLIFRFIILLTAFTRRLPVKIKIQKFASRLFSKSAIWIFLDSLLKAILKNLPAAVPFSPKTLFKFSLDDCPLKSIFKNLPATSQTNARF